MPVIKATAIAVLAIGILEGGGQRAGASSTTPALGHPSLSTSYDTVELSRFVVTSMTCGLILTESGQRFGGCQIADGTGPGRPRLDQRVKAAFRGTVTLTLPDNTDSVVIGYGRQPPAEFSARPTVIWPIPGSGTYYMTITLGWHDEFTRSHTTYFVPLWVPRS